MSTTGIELTTGMKARRPALAEALELVSSMRFAICMLVFIAIAAMIGTVMKQGEAMPNYVNQFGPFWFAVFDKLGLYAVYSAWWFLLILTFLIASTALCVTRNGPKMIKDMRSWREHVREDSLRNFHHRSEWEAPLARAALAAQSALRLRHAGYGVKIVEKEHGTLLAAKKGAANKFGYIFAHSAIIIILVGGLLDSTDVPIKFQQWFMGKTPYAGVGKVGPEHTLGVGNPTFRANILIPEGRSGNAATIQRGDGVLVQELPFTIALKKFDIEFYPSGIPKLFVSYVQITDHEDGKSFPATIKVNEPLIYKGIAVYQSSFNDGGSRLKLTGFPMSGADGATFPIGGEVGAATALERGGESYSVEWSDFRPFNVENVATDGDLRGVKKEQSLGEQFAAGFDKHTGSAAKGANNKDLKNVGPVVEYKVRDKTGQAREYRNYMQPVTLDGASFYLSGMRASPGDPFTYLRIPADDAASVREWMRLRAALFDPALREQAGKRFAVRATGSDPAMRDQFAAASSKNLAMFATGGFRTASTYIEEQPEAQKKKAAEIYMMLLNGTLWELWQLARERDGLAPVAADETHARFLQLATNALSDSFLYGAPVYLQLDDFEQVKASVLQLTRSPGKKVVYLGCIFLVLGVFSMFYIRERRLWVWLKDAPGGATHALMAMSTQRKTLDFEREFNDIKTTLPQAA